MSFQEPLSETRPSPGRDPAGFRPEPLERLRFWDGRLLVARDLRDQQSSLIRRTEYHQRFAHGAGVLCGFQVLPHPRLECRDRWVVIEPGMAYDGWGRTLWMPDREVVELPPTAAQADGEVFLVVRRRDRPIDPMPALHAEALGDPIRREFGRIREDVELVVVSPSEISEECWPRERPVTHGDREDEITGDDEEDAPSGAPPCSSHSPCGAGVVLARLVRPEASAPIAIDTTHQRVLTPPSNLTIITGVNWTHGGEVSLDDLAAPSGMNGQLIVRFSRPLKPTENDARGINPHTFTVSYLTKAGNVEYILPPDPEDLREGELLTPRLSPNRRCAVFDIPHGLLQGRTSLRNSSVFVSLRGDFLEDCHGRAVSCAHIRGDVANRGTGNGGEGGFFESWFYVS